MKKRILLLGFLLLLLQGCFNREDEKLDHVQLRNIKDVESLNPITYGGLIEASTIMDLMFQSLLTIDLEGNEILPILAEALPEVKVQDSISFFTYTLRKEAIWPNEEPVSASDVLFTLKVINCPLINNDKPRSQTAFIQSLLIDPSSAKTFTFQCEGYVEEMNIMTGGILILPEYKYDPEGILRAFDLEELRSNYEALQDDPRIKGFAQQFTALSYSREPDAFEGSGGYELIAWQVDQYISFKKKEDWWAASLELPYITANPERITYQIIPDDATAIMALKNGQLDVMRDIPFSEFQALKQDSAFLKNYNLFTPPTYTVYYLGINSRLPKFKGKKTRKALAHLLDVENILKVIGQTPQSRANSLISPYDKRTFNEKIEPYVFSLEKAKQLLREDGWQYENGGWYKSINGEKEQLAANIQYKAGDFNYENTTLIFKQAAEKAGIPITISPVENSVLGNNLRQHTYEVYLRGLVGNPFAFNFTPVLHRQSAGIGGMNYTAFGTAESDKLIEDIITTADKVQQGQKIKELQEILHDEANLIFLYFDEQKIAIHKRFENLKISGLYPNFDVSAFKLRE